MILPLIGPLIVRRADREPDAAGDEGAEACSGKYLRRNRVIRAQQGDAKRGHRSQGTLGDPGGEVESLGAHHNEQRCSRLERFPGASLATHSPPAYPHAAMPAADLVITSSRVVTDDGVAPAALAITGETITAIEAPGRSPEARRRVDVGHSVVMAGSVDTHVHVNEPGRTEWEGFESATRAAAAGGVTTLGDMPRNSIPATSSAAALRAKIAAASDQCHVDVGFWGGVVPGNAGELEALAAAGVLG